MKTCDLKEGISKRVVKEWKPSSVYILKWVTLIPKGESTLYYKHDAFTNLRLFTQIFLCLLPVGSTMIPVYRSHQRNIPLQMLGEQTGSSSSEGQFV